MVAEYRALRASVLRLWEKDGSDPGGITRFNESIDEALTKAVESFMQTSEHHRDQSLGILGHDLRNPLSAIVAGADLIRSTEGLDPSMTKVATRMLNSAQQQRGQIVQQLLRQRSAEPEQPGGAQPAQRTAKGRRQPHRSLLLTIVSPPGRPTRREQAKTN